MTKALVRGLVTLLVSFGLCAGYAVAKDNDHREAKERHERIERKRAEVRHERIKNTRERERWHREHAADRRPPGWDHGKKAGWNKCDVPPGQAKRNGCDMKAYYQRHPERRASKSKTPPLTAAQRDAWRKEQEKRRAEWLKQHPQPSTAIPPQAAK